MPDLVRSRLALLTASGVAVLLLAACSGGPADSVTPDTGSDATVESPVSSDPAAEPSSDGAGVGAGTPALSACPDQLFSVYAGWYGESTTQLDVLSEMLPGGQALPATPSCAYRADTTETEGSPAVPYDLVFFIGGDSDLATRIGAELTANGFEASGAGTAQFEQWTGNGTTVTVSALDDSEDVNEAGTAIPGPFVMVSFPTP